MSSGNQVTKQWVDKLFENNFFLDKLSEFTSSRLNTVCPALDQKILAQVNAVTEEIANLITMVSQKDRQQKFDMIAEQIAKLRAQITNLKNAVFCGGHQKMDLETTDYNKSKLQLSSILEQDMPQDFGEVKSSIIEIQQRLNEWFGTKIPNQQFSAGDLSNESKISQFILKKCTEQSQATEKRILKRFETSDLLNERRFEQVTKTMNSVLEMINEGHIKKDRFQESQHDQIKIPLGNQQSLVRQSSLQNLKIKSFFNFGQR